MGTILLPDPKTGISGSFPSHDVLKKKWKICSPIPYWSPDATTYVENTVLSYMKEQHDRAIVSHMSPVRQNVTSQDFETYSFTQFDHPLLQIDVFFEARMCTSSPENLISERKLCVILLHNTPGALLTVLYTHNQSKHNVSVGHLGLKVNFAFKGWT